ncbi:MAG: hypothetical protein ABI811_16520 [Acidobacteriota bacterium]
MATAPQILANRANARHSTGPRTETGKQTSSANAIARGLTAARIFVRPEEQTDFQAFDAALSAEFQPSGANQDHLYALLLHAAWNIRRCYALEGEIQNEAIAQGLADALLDDALSRKLDRIYRYKRMHESTYRRAIAELRLLQTEQMWRRENDELLDEPVLVNTAKVVAAVSTRVAKQASSYLTDLIFAPVPYVDKTKPIIE